ncbi:Oidioi.mRNA.OKI2018_I69.chr1.g1636.t1.cds [Oikopleura dioica]|uniref:Oidioi.mRNA.OKI2018_I69.chr1.g1636.t1.cds n=1 Tax=Oikopleura dioica TaxID=34765 RepID=A0ABN7SNJ0_OIKDI|nr:Oidioi.mRNA.OKI2018_I69.chr1.g1636.t1.cds [Oikopleura dioica]
MYFVWILLIPALEALRPTPRANCPDEELALKCETYCYKDYVTCKDSCESSGCERECSSTYTRCFHACPCFSDCPLGCVDCANSICTCVSPQENNSLYKQCIDEVTTEFTGCVKSCTASQTCYDGCYATFAESSEKCPCNAKCELGCPCDDGYKCQPFITLICQYRTSYNLKHFGYVISADGHYKENRFYNSPQGSTPFLQNAGHALLNGQMMIYGGNQDLKKIGRVDGCNLRDTGKRLINDFYSNDGALVTVPEVHEETILCDGFSAKSCESFDGTTSLAISEMKEMHQSSCMALYNFKAIIIAGYTNGVEVLSVSGWQSEAEHPEGRLFGLSCASIDGGVLTIGGYNYSYTKTVYLFKNGKWTSVGELKNNFYKGSMMMFNDYFIAFDGDSNDNQVERAEWNGTHVTSSQTLFSHESFCIRPITFESDPDQCSEFCSNDFCYV